MRLSILFAILLLTSPAFAQKDDKSKDKPSITRLKKYGFIRDQYDRFTDRRIVKLEDPVQMPSGTSLVMGNGVAIYLYGIAFNEGKDLKPDFKAALTVEIAAGQRVPLFEAAPIYILYDDQRLALEKTERERKLEDRPVHADLKNRMAVISQINWDDYRKVAAAKEVEIKVDRFVFKLKPEALENMRSFVEYVEKVKQK